MKVAVIGGGASGLTAAISAAKQGAQVTVFEKNSRCFSLFQEVESDSVLVLSLRQKQPLSFSGVGRLSAF